MTLRIVQFAGALLILAMFAECARAPHADTFCEHTADPFACEASRE